MSAAALAALRPVSLAELEQTAALQTRVDRKYVVPREVVDHLVRELAGGPEPAWVLEIDGARSFAYESVYFDTPDLRLYLAAARNRPRRAKVRTRTYVDSGLCVLEVKTRDARGRTVKHRQVHEAARANALAGDAQEFLATFEALADVRTDLVPALVTRFRRTTLLAGAARATVDTDLSMESTDGALAELTGAALVETKSAGGPSVVDRLLWAAHHRPVRVSKYGAGLGAVHADLPHNRWNRVVRRHLETTPAAGDVARRTDAPAAQSRSASMSTSGTPSSQSTRTLVSASPRRNSTSTSSGPASATTTVQPSSGVA